PAKNRFIEKINAMNQLVNQDYSFLEPMMAEISKNKNLCLEQQWALVFKDILTAYNISIWLKQDSLWAKIEQNIIAQQRNPNQYSAIHQPPVKTKVFVKAWKKIERSIGKNEKPWP
ncbi:18506_t:CDS:2, partial [Gigaspora rosea]